MLDLFALGALNHLLADAPWARERLRPYAGHRGRIALEPLKLDFSIAQDGTLQSLTQGDIEVEIILPPGAPLAALKGRDAMLRGARVAGAADFAEALSFVLRNLDWDAEEDFSKLLGDVAARRLVDGAKKFVATKKNALEHAVENVTEYLLYEKPQWLSKPASAVFGSVVSQLDTDTAALERRIGALESRRR